MNVIKGTHQHIDSSTYNIEGQDTIYTAVSQNCESQTLKKKHNSQDLAWEVVLASNKTVDEP